LGVGSHGPDTVTFVRSIEVIDSNVVLAWSKFVHHESFTIATNASWISSHHGLPIAFTFFKDVSREDLRKVLLIMANIISRLWPKSLGILVTLD